MQTTKETDYNSRKNTENGQDTTVLVVVKEQKHDESSQQRYDDSTTTRTKLYWIITIALLLCYFASGLEASLLGSTFSHMEVFLQTTTQRLSIVFLLSELGYLTGSFICGLLLDVLNKEILISISCVLFAITTVVAPLWPHLYWFLAFSFLEYVNMGFLESGIQSYAMRLWKDLRQKESLVQALHCLWSLGAAISPVLIRPFLLPLTTCNTTTQLNVTTSIPDNSTQLLSAEQQLDNSCNIRHDVGYVRYAYIMIGCLIMAFNSVAIVTFIVQLVRGNTLECASKDHTKSSDTKRNTKEEYRLKLLLFVAIVLFFVSCGYVEQIPSGYLPLFAIEYFRWDADYAAMLLTVLFICHFVGRLLGIFISLFARSRTLLGINVGLVLLAYVLMAFVKFREEVIWVGTALGGIAMSTLFPTGILVISEVFPITGRMMALFVIGYSIGSTTGPVVLGQIFDSSGPYWMVYILIIAAVVEGFLYVMLIVTIRTYRHFVAVYHNNNVVMSVECEQLSKK